MKRCIACILKQPEGTAYDAEDICDEGEPCEDPEHTEPEKI